MSDTQIKAEPPSAATRPDFAERLAEAEHGPFISSEAVEEWAASWLTPGELPPPEPDVTLSGVP